jgi:hypothetical protein
VFVGLCSAAAMAKVLTTTEVRAYRRDVDFVVQRILAIHPGAFAHADRAAFLKDAAAIKASAASRDLGCATAELMALVAKLQDGHTYILPVNIPGEMRWFPIRFYAFPDGMYVTSVAPEFAELAGKRVLKLGTLDADSALRKAVAIQAANNPLAAREGAVWLSQAAIASALGAASDGRMEVTVADSSGNNITRTLMPFEAEINDGWNQQGEMFGPRRLNDAQSYVTAFGGRGPLGN